MKAKASDVVLLMFAVSISSAIFSAEGAAQQRVNNDKPSSLSTTDVSFYAKLLQLVDQRNFNDTLLRAGFSSTSVPIRWASSLTLAQLVTTHRERVLPVLRELVLSNDTALSANATFGLGLAKDTSSIATLSSIVERGGTVARTAAWALGEIGSPAQSAISSLISRKSASMLLTELLYASAKIRPLDISVVVPHLSSIDINVRGAAVYAIARQGVPAGVRPILSMPREDAFVRSQIARALRRSAVGDSLETNAFDMLIRLARDEYVSVRINATYSLASYGTMARDALLEAIADRDANVRIAAAQSVGHVLGPDSAQWEILWNADTSFTFRTTIVESAIRAGYQMPILNNWRTHSNWRYRAAFVRAWSAAPDPVDAKVIALIAANDSDSRVRSVAYEIFVSSDRNREDSVIQQALRDAVADPDPVARESIPWYKRDTKVEDSLRAERSVEWYENVVREVVVPSIDGPPPGAIIETNRGMIHLSMLGVHAPLTVYNFMTLARQGFFKVTRFHRVVPNFVAQDGDPRGDGNGGPGYAIRDEFNRETYVRGSVGMATAGPDTGGSQYFLTLSPQPYLDGHYTLFARVVTGIAVMDALVQGDIIKSIIIP